MSGRRVLQREQRTRTPLTVAERERLIPDFDADIALLESLTGLQLEHWRDPATRPPLDVRGRSAPRTPASTGSRRAAPQRLNFVGDTAGRLPQRA